MEDSNYTIFGTQGWKQFLDNKISMLYKFDLAKKYSKGQIVEVAHGNVAEAEIRKWLSEFLPIKYGVCSGYIVSQNLEFVDQNKLPHYDVIIYDRFNSPTLWVEINNDKSESGRSRAIPAEYVRAVFEVKSRLTTKTAKDSLDKLRELKKLIITPYELENPYDGKIRSNFFCASIFFELKKEDEFDRSILNNLIPNDDVHNYYGGIILNAEGRNIEDTGKYFTMVGEDFIESKNESNIFNFPISDSVKISDTQYMSIMLTWAVANFSIFAFDILALLEGKYRQGYISSNYGMSWLRSNSK